MKRFLLILFLVGTCCNSFAQNRDSKWTVGVSGSLVNFGETGPNSVGDRFLYQFPKISLSRYVIPSITFDLSASISTLDEVEGFYSNNFNYFSTDAVVRYDFGTSKENLVPYIGVGLGFIGAPETILNSELSTTANFVFGGTFWFSPKFGFNGEIVYKYVSDTNVSMRPHTQISAGLVYSFKPRQMVQRLWHRRR